MYAAGHLAGGGEFLKRMKLGAAQVNPGIIMMAGATGIGVIPTTATLVDTLPSHGLAVDVGTYSTTPASGAEGIVTVSARPDLIIKSLASGAAADNTALAILTQTSASSTVLTATVMSANIEGGILFCLTGANAGLSRGITTHTSTTSLTVTVAFPFSMAVGDTFAAVPWNWTGTGANGGDGNGWVQASTLFTQARADIASGTGIVCSVVDLDLNGTTDTYVSFTLNGRGHAYGSNAAA